MSDGGPGRHPVLHPSVEQATEIPRSMMLAVESIVGAPSSWNGHVIFDSTVDSVSGVRPFNGKLEWDGGIRLHRFSLTSVLWYSTGLHELFHSVSAGVDHAVYRQWRGYEESVIENMVRLYRDKIFQGLGVPQPFDVRVSYNREVEALESLRREADRAPEEFYIGLINTRLSDREETVIQWIEVAQSEMSRRELLIRHATEFGMLNR